MAASRTAPILSLLRSGIAGSSTSSLRSLTSPTLNRLCPQCRRPCYYRPFSVTSRPRSSSKRLLMTESAGAYQPHSLNPGPPPPRGTGIPESSIAGGLPQDGKKAQQTWLSNESSEPGVRNNPGSEQQTSSFAVPEKVAQQPRPVPQATSDQPHPTNTSKPTRPARSKLRARKAAMTLTPAAVSHLRELLDDPEPKLIRVGVKNKGCSGSAYHLEYVDKPGMFDEQVEQDGVKVLVDSKALIKVIGSEMDWVEDKLSARFTFRNPNITEQCGCGESFSIV